MARQASLSETAGRCRFDCQGGTNEIKDVFTDGEGAFRVEVLPNVKYALSGFQLTNDPGEIEVRANETKNLDRLIMAATPKPPIN